MSAEVKVLSGGAMRRFMVEAVPLFERASGIRIAVRFGPTRELTSEIEGGAPFDLALLPRQAIDVLTESGRVAAGRSVDAVRSLVGLVVREGASIPDLSTVDAFKDVLRNAKSISYSRGPSGLYVADLLERLGLAAETMDKTVFAVGHPVAALVAEGVAEIGMQQIIEILPVEGARLAGPLPAGLQNYVLYTAGTAVGAAESAAVGAFVAFLKSPEAIRIMAVKGLEPG